MLQAGFPAVNPVAPPAGPPLAFLRSDETPAGSTPDRMPKQEDTPLMRQWREAKARHADALVFFRVGDFYEMFNEDAEEGARLLGLTLTARNNGGAADVPLDRRAGRNAGLQGGLLVLSRTVDQPGELRGAQVLAGVAARGQGTDAAAPSSMRIPGRATRRPPRALAR